MQTFSQTRTSTLGLQPNNYIYTLVPTSKGLAAISSDDSLRIFDPESSQSHTLARLDVHKSVTCLEGFTADLVATAGRDGSVRFWDVRDGLSRPVIEWVSGFPISALACSESTNCVAAGAELESNGPGEAPVVVWDVRNPKTTILKFTESHTDTITGLQLQDAGVPLLLSASTDGLINVFDLAASQSSDDEEPLQVVNHGSAVHHAGFLPPVSLAHAGAASNGCLYGLSSDESFSIYPFERPDDEQEEGEAQIEPPTVFGDVRNFLGCEYVIDVKADGGMDARDPVMAVGNHSEQYVEIIPFSQTLSSHWQLDTAACIRLYGAHGEEIVRDFHVNHESGTIFTCGEDGFVRAWRGSSPQGQEDVEMDEEAATKVTKREKKRKKADTKVKEGRFKPY